MADTWTAITLRCWGDKNADGTDRYEREVTTHETVDEAWERASDDVRHSERKNEIIIIDDMGIAHHYTYGWNEKYGCMGWNVSCA